MDAKYINRSCIQAVRECPSEHDYGPNDYEVIKGKSRRISKLHKLGARKVLDYWLDHETYGGGILWAEGYWERLPIDVRELLIDIDAALSGAYQQTIASRVTGKL